MAIAVQETVQANPSLGIATPDREPVSGPDEIESGWKSSISLCGKS